MHRLPPAQVDEWLWENPGRASAAVHFTMEGPQVLCAQPPADPMRVLPAQCVHCSCPAPSALHTPSLAPLRCCTQALRYVVQSNSSVRFFKGSYQDPTSHVALPLQVSLEAAFARLALNRERLAGMRHSICLAHEPTARPMEPPDAHLLHRCRRLRLALAGVVPRLPPPAARGELSQ